MSSNHHAIERRIVGAMAVNALGSAITYTGLPIFMAGLTGNLRHASGLFVVETLASLLMTAAGGALSDRGDKRRLYVVPTLASGALMAVLALILAPSRTWAFYGFGLCIAALNSIAGAAIQSWFNLLIHRGEIERRLGSKTAVMMAAKLVGMGSGPILFSTLGDAALLLDAMSYVAAAAVVFGLSAPSGAESGGKKESLRESLLALPELARNTRYVGLLGVSALSGVLALPFVNAALLTLQGRFSARPEMVSAIWLVGSIGSLFTNTLISKGLFRSLDRQMALLGAHLLMAGGITAMSLAPSVAVFVPWFAAFTLSNPLISNLIVSELVRRADPAAIGRINSLQSIVIDIAALTGVLALTHASIAAMLPKAMLGFLPVLALRYWIGTRTLANRAHA